MIDHTSPWPVIADWVDERDPKWGNQLRKLLGHHCHMLYAPDIEHHGIFVFPHVRRVWWGLRENREISLTLVAAPPFKVVVPTGFSIDVRDLAIHLIKIQCFPHMATKICEHCDRSHIPPESTGCGCRVHIDEMRKFKPWTQRCIDRGIDYREFHDQLMLDVVSRLGLPAGLLDGASE